MWKQNKKKRGGGVDLKYNSPLFDKCTLVQRYQGVNPPPNHAVLQSIFVVCI